MEFVMGLVVGCTLTLGLVISYNLSSVLGAKEKLT